jgi:acyl-CoA thioester hydrolase
MDDLLQVETVALRVGGASMELAQRVLRGQETLVSARVRVACVLDGRPARLPAAIRAKLPTP